MTPTTKTILTYIIVFILVLIVIVGLFFYLALRNKKKEVSTKEPYAAIMGQQLLSLHDALLIDNSTLHFAKKYPNELQDGESIDTAHVKHRVIPKGSTYRLDQAFHITHGVSGNTFAYLLGEVMDKDTQTKYPIIYQWGNFKTICLEAPCNYWEYRKAPWQAEIDAKKYFP